MATQTTGRDGAGRFEAGNPGGPGRPRRETERSYLAVISEACPPDVWREIVERTVERARYGNDTARAWLAGYLVGTAARATTSLHQLAVEEEDGADPVATDAKKRQLSAELQGMLARATSGSGAG